MVQTKNRKKRRIAKHILRAQGRKRKEQQETDGIVTPTDNTAKKKKAFKKAHVKDPKEAQEYLSLWKYSQETWKFNKNTQSWVLRHMYDVEKIPKATFGILMDYLEGLKGVTRDWVNEDAVRRVMRYKEWEKKQKLEDVDESVKNDGDDNQASDKQKEDSEDIKEDDKRFQALNEHDKRKEYKRARKVVETMKNTNNEE